MLNHLQAATRLLIRTSIALFTAVVLLLIQSAFWTGRVSVWMQAIIVATALLSYFRPPYGLLALAAVVPFGQMGSRTLDSQMRGAESLVLAFLAGALVRKWTLREFRAFPFTRLDVAILIFGFVIAASCAEQIWVLQIQRDYPWTFIQTVLSYAGRNYLTAFRGFEMIFRAMLLLEGLALLAYIFHFVRRDRIFGERLIAMIVAGAVGTALLTMAYVASQLSVAPEDQRWVMHVGDVNAAGSFFAMTMVLACGLAIRQRRYRVAWAAAGIVLAGAVWLTYSRTALVAVALVAVFCVAIITLGRIIGAGRTIVMTSVVSVAVMISLWNFLPREYFGYGAVDAMAIRRLFLVTTWRMLLDQPLFGVGIGQYALQSNHFAVPELFKYYERENAHNNFAQVAGELGLTGLAAFVLVLVISLRVKRGTDEGARRTSTPLLFGLAAFMLTWLGGHPLLVPEVAYPFWIALGIVAALITDANVGTAVANLICGTAAVVLLISVPLRVHEKGAAVDLSRVGYGLSSRHIMTSRARLFAPAGSVHIDIPLRARRVSDEEPVHIDVFVNDTFSESITMTNREWQTARVTLPGNPSGRFHEIELRMSSPDRADDIDAAPASVEVGTWDIVPKPHG